MLQHIMLARMLELGYAEATNGIDCILIALVNASYREVSLVLSMMRPKLTLVARFLK
jgi:hypothetical protein